MKSLLFSCLLLSLSLDAAAQSTPPGSDSPQNIVRELLRQISIDKGEKIDLEAVKALFYPGATFSILMHDEDADVPLESIGLEDFVEMLDDPYYEAGFSETELLQQVDEYNGIAQVLQTTYAEDSDGQTGKTLTLLQLVEYQDRWWIMHVLWTLEDNGVMIPVNYLPD